MKKKSCQIILVSLLLVFTLGFIFGNSALSSAKSNAISNAITETLGAEIVSNPEERANATTWFTSDFIRKSAHVLEFAVLGFETYLLFQICAGGKPQIFPSLFLGTIAALTDETIQSFSDRSSLVKDVWIDLFGVCLGICTALLILALKRKFTAKKQNGTRNDDQL